MLLPPLVWQSQAAVCSVYSSVKLKWDSVKNMCNVSGSKMKACYYLTTCTPVRPIHVTCMSQDVTGLLSFNWNKTNMCDAD